MFLALDEVRQRAVPPRNRNLRAATIFSLLLLVVAPLAAQQSERDRTTQRASAMVDAGDIEGALDLYTQRLRSLAPQSAERAAVLDAMSAIETDSGQYDFAVRHAEEAARIYAAAGNLESEVSSLNQMGLAETYASHYESARRTYESALKVSTRNTESIVELWTNLGNVHFFTGRYNDAANAYEQARLLIDGHAPAEWKARRRRIYLANRATLDQRLGRYVEALRAYQLVLSDAASLRPSEAAQVQSNIGVVYRRLGDPYKALESYDRAMRLFAEDANLDGELGTLKNRGIVLALDLHRLDEALKTFDDALRRATAAGNQREALQARLYAAETSLRLGDEQRAATEFNVAHQEARALETAEEEWKALFGMARAAQLRGDAAGATQNLRSAITVIERIREAIRIPQLRSDYFNDKRIVYDALLTLRLRAGAPAAELFDLMERSRSRAWRERVGVSGDVSLTAVQQRLQIGEVLLEYWASTDAAALIEVHRNSARVHSLAIRESDIRALDAALSSPARGAWRAAAERVAAQLLPRDLRIESRHCIVVADGPLALVPFEVLPRDGKPLIERTVVSYLPTAALLHREYGFAYQNESPNTLRLRVFADPVGAGAPRLEASGDEARAIARQLGGSARLFLREEARKSALIRPPSAPLLHIASHAVAEPSAIERSRILFSPEDEGGAVDYLYLKEAYELPLNGVQLAVLSACETERGPLLRAEGVQSFSRAFLASGAESTVTTLWRVPDRPTAAFMKLFYHHLQRGESRAEALRQAKLRFLSDKRLNDPHYWAAFVLTGEGSTPVSTSIRWSSIFLVAAATIAAAGVLVAWRRKRSAQR